MQFLDRMRLGSGLILALATALAASASWAAPPQAGFTHSVFGAHPTGQECVAPCFVFFDAGSSSDAEATREFHELDYRWDFGDPGSGTLRTGKSANATHGAIAGHMYETPGRYTVTLEVIDTDGESDTATTEIEVRDPVEHFAGAIYCVSTGSSFGSWCPAGAVHVGDQTHLNLALAGTPNVDGASVWAVLRCGETWSVSSRIYLHNGTRPGLISSRDDDGGWCPTPPRIHYDDTVFSVGDSWTVSGVLLDGPNSVSGIEHAFSLNHGDDGFVVHRSQVIEASGGTLNIGGGSGTVASRVAVWGSSFEMSPNGNETGSNMFMSGHSFAIINSLIDNHLQAEFNLRFVGGRNIVISDSEWRRPGYDTSRNHIQIRGTDPERSQNGRAVIRRNTFISHGHSVGPFLRFCRDAGCNSDGPRGNASMEDIIVENNHMRFDRPVTTTPNFGLVTIQAGEVTVRNNTFDLRGLGSTGARLRMCNVATEPRGGGSYGNVHCFNNTLYTGDPTNVGVILCAEQVGSGHRCYNNLAYLPNASGSFAVTEGSWQAGANVRASASPFALGDQPGARFATRGGEFALAQTGDSAVDRGLAIAETFANAVHRDWDANCRQDPIDVGAFEFGSSSVGCATSGSAVPPPPPILLP